MRHFTAQIPDLFHFRFQFSGREVAGQDFFQRSNAFSAKFLKIIVKFVFENIVFLIQQRIHQFGKIADPNFFFLGGNNAGFQFLKRDAQLFMDNAFAGFQNLLAFRCGLLIRFGQQQVEPAVEVGHSVKEMHPVRLDRAIVCWNTEYPGSSIQNELVQRFFVSFQSGTQPRHIN